MSSECSIHVIFTGGTIGSKSEKGVISADKKPPYELIEKCPHASINFSTSEPYRILSENLNAAHLLALMNEIKAVIAEKQPDGIIIAHGSDTIQYTAAFLSSVFKAISLPIVLVASAYVLGDKRANGFDNFNSAALFIRDFALSGKAPGVYVSYRNPDSRAVTLHSGSSLLRPLTFSADIESADILSKDALYLAMPNIDTDKLQLNSEFDSILWLVERPGISYPKSLDGIRVILLESYHSGTLCIDKNLKSLAKAAEALHIPVFLAGLAGTEDEYDTVAEYKNMGIIPLCGMTPINIYILLWIIISNKLSPLDCLKHS